ncbi:Uncharacterised protein [Serratia quinivorans]|uniref:putative T6SS immunity periplasmic lipoprotein n=1 Tax=Serratia quinivorans TaxID=137545 RepID=UPI0021798F67|nr:putative T6SS immunity periplasmic lipoprotein [Serratia quinivorans]CAI1644989.1 Uncharacterised protein [Serratia quinivorans]
MKVMSAFIPVLLTTSCHLNDPRPENHRANVTTVGNSVCVTSPDSEGENISSLNISEVGNGLNALDKTFTMENAPKLYPNECAPNFGFKFEYGKSYIFSINSIRISKNNTVKNGRAYSVTFSLWMDKGELKAVDIN